MATYDIPLRVVSDTGEARDDIRKLRAQLERAFAAGTGPGTTLTRVLNALRSAMQRTIPPTRQLVKEATSLDTEMSKVQDRFVTLGEVAGLGLSARGGSRLLGVAAIECRHGNGQEGSELQSGAALGGGSGSASKRGAPVL